MKYNPEIVCDHYEDEGIKRPDTEYKFAASVEYEDRAGRKRKRGWAFDFAWPARLVALEVEGGIWIAGGHNRGGGYAKDMAKYNSATLLGWRIIRVQPKEVCMSETVEMIRAALALPCSQPLPKPRTKL